MSSQEQIGEGIVVRRHNINNMEIQSHRKQYHIKKTCEAYELRMYFKGKSTRIETGNINLERP